MSLNKTKFNHLHTQIHDENDCFMEEKGRGKWKESYHSLYAKHFSKCFTLFSAFNHPI